MFSVDSKIINKNNSNKTRRVAVANRTPNTCTQTHTRAYIWLSNAKMVAFVSRVKHTPIALRARCTSATGGAQPPAFSHVGHRQGHWPALPSTAVREKRGAQTTRISTCVPSRTQRGRNSARERFGIDAAIAFKAKSRHRQPLLRGLSSEEQLGHFIRWSCPVGCCYGIIPAGATSMWQVPVRTALRRARCVQVRQTYAC